MSDGVIITSYLFDDWSKFPWDYLGMSVPMVGNVHSYLCSVLYREVAPKYQGFMVGNPSWREVKNMARKSNESILGDIVDYCESLYTYPKSEKPNTAQQVLDFLRKVPKYKEQVQLKLDSLYSQGLITVPSHMLRIKK
jgi:hypothetical protein